MQNGPFSKIKAPSQATYFRKDTPIETPRPPEQASSSQDVEAALEASLRAERDAIAEGEKKLAEAMMHGQSFNIPERKKDNETAVQAAMMLLQGVPPKMGGLETGLHGLPQHFRTETLSICGRNRCRRKQRQK